METLTPYYKLRYDTVGQRLGLSIARRLGVPQAACAAAEAALAPDARQLREVLAHLHDTQEVVDRERAAATTERERLPALRQRHQVLVTELEEKKRRVEEELRKVKQYAQTLRRERRAFTRERLSPPSLALTTPDQRQELTPSPLPQVTAGAPDEAALRGAIGADRSALQIGDEVEAQARHIRGELVALRRDRARIRQNGTTFDVPRSQIRKVS